MNSIKNALPLMLLRNWLKWLLAEFVVKATPLSANVASKQDCQALLYKVMLEHFKLHCPGTSHKECLPKGKAKQGNHTANKELIAKMEEQ